MPLFRIESRPKQGAPTPKPTAGQRGPNTRPGALTALAAGALIGLLGIVAVSAFVVARGRALDRPAPPAPGADVVGGNTSASGPATAVPALPPLSPDFPPESIIAYVNGQTYAMAELERAVRVARVLGAFTGDEVPPDASPELRGFMVRMLRRQIDILLMRQAISRDKILEPTGDVNLLVDGFLGEVQGTREQLASLMAANGVTDADLAEWFQDARAVNFYIQNSLLLGHEAEDRDTVVQEWLKQQWDNGEIVVQFYDPDEVLP